MKDVNTLKNHVFHLCLFFLGIFIKIIIIHAMMGIEASYYKITLSNFITTILLFSFACFVNENRRGNILLAINLGLSLLFLSDTMYFHHFFTLIPVHSIYQIRQVGAVSNSIVSLMKPQYLLFFVDTLLLWILLKRKELVFPVFMKSHKKMISLIMVILMFSTSLLIYEVGVDTEGNYTPYNLGVINYHLYDMMDFFVKGQLDIDKVEAIMNTINQEDEKPKAFGLAKGRNIITIQAESLQNFVINREMNGQSITPVLNNLINQDSIYFKRYYEQVGWGNTSDAEFISHNSFYPSTKTFSYKAFEDNKFASFPMLLKEEGYSTIAFHGNEGGFWNRENIYPSQGIDNFISLEDLQQDELIGIGLSDGSLFRQSVDFLKKQPQPFYAFYITLTSHHPFIIEEQYKGLKIEGEYQDTVLEDYLQSVHYLDQQIGNFIDMLKAEGLYEDSIIVIYGDHEGLDMRDEETYQLLTDFLGKPYQNDEMFRVPFIVHIPNSGLQQEVTTAGGQIDFFPTMANLMGIEIDGGKLLGKDLLNTQDGFIAMQVHVARGSFIDNEKVFIMSNDGIFENSKAWNIYTREAVDLEECREGYERALAEISLSEYILQNDLIPLVHEKGLEYILETHQ